MALSPLFSSRTGEGDMNGEHLIFPVVSQRWVLKTREMQIGSGSGPNHNRVNKQKLPELLESVRSSAWLIVLPLQSEIMNTLLA